MPTCGRPCSGVRIAGMSTKATDGNQRFDERFHLLDVIRRARLHRRRKNAERGDVDRDAPGRLFDDQRNGIAVLFLVQRRGFAGSADRDDGVGSLRHVPVDQSAERIFINPTIGVHGGHDGDQTALDHPLAPLEI